MGVKFSLDQLARTPAGQRSGVVGPASAKASPQGGTLFSRIPPRLWIGIDPGVSTGFAVWHPRQGMLPGTFVEVSTLTFVATVRRLEKLAKEFGPTHLRARIENPKGNRPTFDKGAQGAAIREKVSQNVGSNKRDAQLLMDFLDDLGIPYDAIVPKKKVKGPAGKITQDFFKGVAGFPARSSQHARDASELVVNL